MFTIEDFIIIDDALKTAEWQSYDINWVKPIEKRVFTIHKGKRIMLQKFLPCSMNEIYFHNHPFQHKTLIIQGSLEQGISTSYNAIDYIKDIDTNNQIDELWKNMFSKMILHEHSEFSIDSPNCWHYVFPLYDNPVYSIMITDTLWYKGPKAPHEIQQVDIHTKNEIKEIVQKYLINKFKQI